MIYDRLRELDVEEELRRLSAAEEARKKDRERAERTRLQQEHMRRWEQQIVERDCNAIARETVRTRKRDVEKSLAANKAVSMPVLVELIYCLKRFPQDGALQVDGFQALLQCAEKSPPVCEVLLEENVAAILQASLEVSESNIVSDFKSIADRLASLLARADDLKRAMPIAFERDLRKLRASQMKGNFLSEERFWESVMKRIAEGRADPAELKKSKKANDKKLPPYEVSTDNSTLIKSIFDRNAQPPFDPTARVRTPPLVPVQEDLRMKGFPEVDKWDEAPGAMASGSFLHTPYAIPPRLPIRKSRSRGEPRPKARSRSPEASKVATDVNGSNESLVFGEAGAAAPGSTVDVVGSVEEGEGLLFFEQGAQVLVLDEAPPDIFFIDNSKPMSRPQTAPFSPSPGNFDPWQPAPELQDDTFDFQEPSFASSLQRASDEVKTELNRPPVGESRLASSREEGTSHSHSSVATARSKSEAGLEASPTQSSLILPPLDYKDFSYHRSTVSSPKLGPTPDKVKNHATVQKIFKNAAPQVSIVRNKYQQAKRKASSPLQGVNNSPGGRRHSIRDMLAIFQVLDEGDSGILRAEKFSSALQAMSSLQVQKPEVESMLRDFGVDIERDHIDYEEFCASGQILRIIKHPPLSNTVPFAPWLDQISRPAPDRSAHVSVTWEQHVKWYQKRREHALLWLMKRALKAQKHIRVQRKVAASLAHKARQALIHLSFKDHMAEIMPHFKKRVVAFRELRSLVAHARRHKEKQLLAFRGLIKFTQVDDVKTLITRFDRRNYNMVYYLGFRRKIAYDWLNALGRHSIQHAIDVEESAAWLRKRGSAATVHFFACIDDFAFLTQRANRAMRTWAKKDNAFFQLSKTAVKYRKVWDNRKAAIRFLIERGQHSIAHLKRQADCGTFLAVRGQVANDYTTRMESAQAYLQQWGYDSTHHVALQQVARDWLANRIAKLLVIKKMHDDAQKELASRGTSAKRHAVACGKARGVLVTRIEMARQRRERGLKALDDLALFVDDARSTMSKRALEIQCPGKIKDTEKAIKTEDKEKEKKRKVMSVEARFLEELKDAFDYFDTDGGGEIDKIEFRHLLNSGYLLQIPIEEIDDCYAQIDKDGSGGVDFGEFFAWFNHEWSHDRHKGKKNGFRVANIIPIRQRAIRMILPKFQNGDLTDDFGNAIIPPGKEIIVEGLDDRWWLDDNEKKARPFSEYLKRKAERKKAAEERLAKEEKERANPDRSTWTTEEKAAARKADEEAKLDKVAEMKRKLEAKKKQIEEENGGGGMI